MNGNGARRPTTASSPRVGALTTEPGAVPPAIQEVPDAGTLRSGHGTSSGVSILIVDDHRLFGEALRSLLEGRGMRVVGIATDEREALELVRSSHPEVVLQDVALGGRDGAQVGLKILEERPATRILALNATEDPKTLVALMRTGFHGYLTKDIPLDGLVTAISASLQGHAIMPQKLAALAAGAHSGQDADLDLRHGALTPREQEVLELLVDGSSSEDLAAALWISSNTVRTHIQNILTKLQVHSRLEAVAYATQHGLVSDSRGAETPSVP